MKDPSKPDGEAVNADGSLKDANQINWMNSPTDELPVRPPILGPNEVGDAAKPGTSNMPVRWQFGSKHHDENDSDDMDIDLHVDKPEDENLKVDDGHGEDEKNEEDGNEEEDDNLNIDAGEEDIDEEADKRYWEAKAKEGVSKVCAWSRKKWKH